MGFVTTAIKNVLASLRGADPRSVYADNSMLAGLFSPLTDPPTDIGPLGEVVQTSPALYRIIHVISGDAALVPLCLCRRTGPNSHEVIDDHPAINILRRPDEFTPQKLFWQGVYSDLLSYGNAYIHMRVQGGVPAALMRLPPADIKIVADKQRTVRSYVWKLPDGTTETYPALDILHFRTRSHESPYLGMSPLEPLRQTILLDRQMRKWNWNRFKNNVPATLILQTEQSLGGEKQKEAMRDYLRRKLQGVEHAGDPLLLDGEKWKVDTINRPNEEEIAFLSGLKFIRGEYTMNYGIPPSQVSDWSDSFRSNSKEQTRDYVTSTVFTWNELVRGFLNEVFLPRFWKSERQLMFKHDYSSVPALQQNEYDKAQVQEILVRSGIRTPNEAREKIGDDTSPEEALNKHYWMGKELGAAEAPAVAPPGAGEDPGEEPAPDDTGPEDDTQRGLKLVRQLTDEEIFILLFEDDLLDEAEEELMLRQRVAPFIAAFAVAGALQWLRLQRLPESVNTESADFEDFIDRQTIKLAGFHTRATIEAVRDAIRQGNAEGLPIDRYRRLLSSVFKGRRAAWELDRIARTEVHQSLEGGAYLAAVSEPSVTSKRWVTSRDERVRGPLLGETRADHHDMDNQVVPIAAKFSDPISHAQLRFPGDADGAVSGADVINCRCTMVAEFEEQERQVDRDEFWYKRNLATDDNERTLRRVINQHLVEMEQRVLSRLDSLVKERLGRTA